MASRRGTRRLTFRTSNGTVSLVRQERLDMICPPQVGVPPDRAIHGGFWVELRDAADQPTFSRIVPPLGTSVEVHSPDGTISREFGPPADTVFQVLVPDRPDATTLVLVGEPSRASRADVAADGDLELGADPAVELARFDLGA